MWFGMPFAAPTGVEAAPRFLPLRPVESQTVRKGPTGDYRAIRTRMNRHWLDAVNLLSPAKGAELSYALVGIDLSAKFAVAEPSLPSRPSGNFEV
jgi:hypothetical protein